MAISKPHWHVWAEPTGQPFASLTPLPTSGRGLPHSRDVIPGHRNGGPGIQICEVATLDSGFGYAAPE